VSDAITAEVLLTALSSGDLAPTVLDVREDGEVARARIEGSVHVPLAQLGARASTFDPEAPIVMVCAVGGRARKARDLLVGLGFTRVTVLEGGMTAWLSRGHPAVGTQVPAKEASARYDRQIRLPEVGPEGQATLVGAKVAVVGAGGLGCPLLLYLVAAGVGKITIVDFDDVALSNLHRQVLYGMGDVGRPKAIAAREALLRRNPGVKITSSSARLAPGNAASLLEGHDVLVDATDSFAARYALNRASCMLSVPAVFGAVSRFSGEVLTHTPGEACYACLHPVAPGPELAPTCAEEGVLGVVPGVIGMLQANEVLKLLLGYGEPLASKLLTFDARTSTFRTLALPRDPTCATCAG